MVFKLTTKMRKQTAVYWGNPKPDGKGGFTVDDPVEIQCRWVDKAKTFVDRNSQERTSRAKVFVDRDLSLSGNVNSGWGFLYLGTIASLSDPTANPGKIKEAWEIGMFSKASNLRNTVNNYVVML